MASMESFHKHFPPSILKFGQHWFALIYFTSSTFTPTVNYDNGFCIAGEKSFNVYKITTDAKIKCNEARNSTADDK